MSEKHKCVARVSSGWSSHACGKNAGYEHDGKHYCKTHHPPTVKAKDEARSAAWQAQWDKEKAARKAKMDEAAEKNRRADLFTELLALLVESQTSIGGDWRERRDALIDKAQP